MSTEQEIDSIIEDDQEVQYQDEPQKAVALAAQEVANLLSATGDSFGAICAEIETAKSEETCRSAFRRFNSVLRIFLLTARAGEDAHVHEAIRSLEPSVQFQTILEEQPDISSAIAQYKETMLRNLAASIRSKQSVDIVSEKNDELLFARILDEPQRSHDHSEKEIRRIVPPMKRGAEEVADESLEVVHKRLKSSIPALSA